MAFLQSTKQSKPCIDWDAKKSKWLKQVDTLYCLIQESFSSFEKEVSLKRSTIDINEEFVGCYETERLTLELPSAEVTFTPKGLNVIGAQGRVDIEGPAGKVKLVLVPKSASKAKIQIDFESESSEELNENSALEDIVWKIATPAPNIRFIDLTQENLLDAIMEVVNG